MVTAIIQPVKPQQHWRIFQQLLPYSLLLLIGLLAPNIPQLLHQTPPLLLNELLWFIHSCHAIYPLSFMMMVLPTMQQRELSIQDLFSAATKGEKLEAAEPLQPSEFEALHGDIHFAGVSFAFEHPNGRIATPVLDHLNLTIEAGKQVGILGAPKSGKTLLMQLLLRLYEPCEGAITLGGVAIDEIQKDVLRSQIRLVAQNNALSVPHSAPMPDLQDDTPNMAGLIAYAMWQMNLLSKPASEPPSTMMPYQRLSIARAFVHQPAILILDEVTAALDLASERHLQQEITRFLPNTTIIYLSQRASTMMQLDKVVLLDHGHVKQVGHHNDLIIESALYRRWVAAQFGKDVLPSIGIA